MFMIIEALSCWWKNAKKNPDPKTTPTTRIGDTQSDREKTETKAFVVKFAVRKKPQVRSNWPYGPSKAQNDKNTPKIDICPRRPPKNTVRVSCLNFLKVWSCPTFLYRTNFSKMVGSLSTGLWTKSLLFGYTKIGFFAIKISKMRCQKTFL